MPRTADQRRERQYDDETIREIVRKQAATPVGASRTILKDRLYTYPDRERVGEIIAAMVRDGELIAASFVGGPNVGRGSTRAFVHRKHAQAFAAGKAPSPKSSRDRKAAAGPKLHDMRDSMGARRGFMPDNIAAPLRKGGSAAQATKPEPTEPRITDRTRVTICESRHDFRYTIQQLPPGYVSALDPREARPWAQAAAQGRAA